MKELKCFLLVSVVQSQNFGYIVLAWCNSNNYIWAKWQQTKVHVYNWRPCKNSKNSYWQFKRVELNFMIAKVEIRQMELEKSILQSKLKFQFQ